MLEDVEKNTVTVTPNTTVNARQPRNNAIIPITNSELLGADGKEVVPTYRLTFYDGESATVETAFDRNGAQRPDKHFAGYTALSPDGLRYVYGLPAYNNSQQEMQFSTQSVAGSNKVLAVQNGSADELYL